MKRNADTGLFTKPAIVTGTLNQDLAGTMNICRPHISSLVFGFCMLCITIAAADAQDEIQFVKDSALSGSPRMMPAVFFPHDAHNEAAELYDCSSCHHVYEGGRKLPDADSVGMECSECHLADPDSDRTDLIRAYHLQCRNCHLDSKAGPILCGQCHADTPR